MVQLVGPTWKHNLPSCKNLPFGIRPALIWGMPRATTSGYRLKQVEVRAGWSDKRRSTPVSYKRSKKPLQAWHYSRIKLASSLLKDRKHHWDEKDRTNGWDQHQKDNFNEGMTEAAEHPSPSRAPPPQLSKICWRGSHLLDLSCKENYHISIYQGGWQGIVDIVPWFHLGGDVEKSYQWNEMIQLKLIWINFVQAICVRSVRGSMKISMQHFSSCN